MLSNVPIRYSYCQACFSLAMSISSCPRCGPRRTRTHSSTFVTVWLSGGGTSLKPELTSLWASPPAWDFGSDTCWLNDKIFFKACGRESDWGTYIDRPEDHSSYNPQIQALQSLSGRHEDEEDRYNDEPDEREETLLDINELMDDGVEMWRYVEMRKDYIKTIFRQGWKLARMLSTLCFLGLSCTPIINSPRVIGKSHNMGK